MTSSQHCKPSSGCQFGSRLLASLDNPGEDNLVLVEHIEGFLVPHKLILVDQALGFAFDYIMLIAHVSLMFVFFKCSSSELKLFQYEKEHLEEGIATKYINFQGYGLKK